MVLLSPGVKHNTTFLSYIGLSFVNNLDTNKYLLLNGFSNRLRAVILFSLDHTRKVTVKLCKLEK